VTTTGRRRKPLPPHGTYARSVGRPSGGIPGCSCPPCSNARRAYKNRRNLLAETGRHLTTDATPAAQHLRQLRARGASWNSLITATRCSTSSIADLLSGRQTSIRATTAARILAVTPAQVIPRPSPITGIGTVRRIQALRAHGWPLTVLGARCGLYAGTLAGLDEDSPVAYRERIAELYDDLHDQNPVRYGVCKRSVTRIRRAARANQWAPPSAWTDIDHDEKPTAPRYWRYSFAKSQPGQRGLDVIHDTAELAANGATREEVAERIGIGWESVVAVHRRGGVELPLSLRCAELAA
jgi:hypothetical protein